jgi:hypothetical protein
MKMFRMDLYESIAKNKQKIMKEIAEIPDKLGMPKEYFGNLGLSGGSGNPPPVAKEVAASMEKASRKNLTVASLDVEIRKIVKSYYGDEYDGALANTCEATLWLSYEVLFTPPLTGRGDGYTSRYIAPLERHMHHQAGYGRPFPPKYKDMTADRGVTSGELGVYSKRLFNLETVMVPLSGADYTCHGIKYYPAFLLKNVNAEASIEEIKKTANRHAQELVGFASIAYDTDGYGYGQKDKNGTPLLQKYIGQLAQEFNVPYVADNARGTPFIGTDPRQTNATIMVYSTDKAFPGPTSGLLIGKEEEMNHIRRALGIQGGRSGSTSSHAKAGYVAFDPSKEVLAGMITMLELLRDTPKRFTAPVDGMYDILLDEISKMNPDIAAGLNVCKTYNGLGVEINYEDCWLNPKSRIPIFSIEDMYAGTCIIQDGMKAMGIVPALGYDASMILSPFTGLVDDAGVLLEDQTRFALRCLLKSMEVLASYCPKE